MAVAVKDAAAAATKFVQRAQAAQGDYSNGVAGAGQKWQQATAAAADSWQQGVQQAAAQGRFAKGVNPTSMAKFQTRSSTVGPARYGQGVAQAGPAWQQGVQPFLTTISQLNLPARGPKGAPQNYQRAQMVGEALRSKKIGGAQ